MLPICRDCCLDEPRFGCSWKDTILHVAGLGCCPMPALGHRHAHSGVCWSSYSSDRQPAEVNEAVFSVGLFALAREQPKQDAIMDISSDGAVNPILSVQPALMDTTSSSSIVSLPPMPPASMDRCSRPPSSVYSAAHPSKPNLHATSHTGAGVFVLSDLGWLAGLDALNRWQDFGGHREGSESPWQTATREFEEEAGISANSLVSLAPPYRMVKNEHIYVIHVAKLLPGAPSPRTNNEILAHKHFTGFSNKFADEIVAPSIVHRRVLDPEFLAIVCKIHTDLLKPARQRARCALLGRPQVACAARCNLGCSRRLTGQARFEFSNEKPRR